MAETNTQPKTENKKHQPTSEELDKEIKDSFPASDPPSSTQPGSGITGPEVKRKH